jgi:integration host factor subunit beta
MTTPELTEAAGDAAVRQVFDAVEKVLLKRGSVEIDGFGEFALRQRKAHRARNPRTNEPIDVPAKVVVRFRPAGALKRQAARLPKVPRGS